MAFKKHNWIKYGRNGGIAKLIIKDETDKQIDSFVWKINDKKSERNIGMIIRKSYGIKFAPEITPEESVNEKERIKKEIDWLKSDSEW